MIVNIKTDYYEQFDADYSLEVPAEAYGGWKSAELPLDLDRTALVIMHAWDTGTGAEYPGWHRAVEYLPRAREICQKVFPPLVEAVRNSPMQLFHVVGGGDYYKNYPGYKETVSLAENNNDCEEKIVSDPVYKKLTEFKTNIKKHNQDDIMRGFSNADFPSQVKPLDSEGIAENRFQLYALCRQHGINHLIYTGFAINWCLLLSPGGMAEMTKYGIICSTIPQAVTAVENKETAREQLCKQIALWRIACAFGYVYQIDDFINSIKKGKRLC